MCFRTVAFAALAAMGLSATGASAATVICDFGGPGPENPALCVNGYQYGDSVGDFSNYLNAPNPSLTVSDDVTIYGGVIVPYMDSWRMNFGSSFYDIAFGFKPGTSNFVGELFVNGSKVRDLVGNLGDALVLFDLGRYTGSVDFAINAVSGDAHWEMDVTSVPLPATGLLLLGALGGLGLASRRRVS